LSNEKGLKIIGVNYKDDPNKTVEWLKELGNPYSDVIVDSKGLIGIDWGVYGIPETYIVNSKGIIKYRLVGSITKKNYNAFYSKIKESED
jgi:cytochrome c biogenesis protein CcmG/thiol:disulfide interchange protein DsbE